MSRDRIARYGVDGGVTLVELLVVIALMGIVVPALTGAVFLGLRTTDATVASLSDSRNRQILPSLFTRDVQSAGTVDTDASVSTCLDAGDTLVVRMRWTETPVSGSAINRVAAWITRTVAGDKILERRSCDDSSGSMTSAGSVSTAYGIVGTPAVSCRTSADVAAACTSAARVAMTAVDASGALSASGRRRSA